MILHDAFISKHLVVSNTHRLCTTVCCTWMKMARHTGHIVGCLLGLQSQVSAKSQQSVLKLIEEILHPHPQPSTTNRRAPPRGPACDHLLVHLWQVQRGSRQPRPEAELQHLENTTQQRCSRCASVVTEILFLFSSYTLLLKQQKQMCAPAWRVIHQFQLQHHQHDN